MSQIAHFLKGVNDKRYLSDFEEICKIGSGGFSSVFKVKNKLDDNFYAVKKIQLRIKDIKNDVNSELERVLREAKFLAKVFHPNVIRYYNSWIELKFDEKNALNLSDAGFSLKNNLFSDELNKNLANFSEETQRNPQKNNELSKDERQQKRKKHKESANEQSEFVLEIDSSNNNLEIAFENQENSVESPVKEGKNPTSSSNFCDADFDSNSNSNIDFDRSNEQENRGKESTKAGNFKAKNVSFLNLKDKGENKPGHFQVLQQKEPKPAQNQLQNQGDFPPKEKESLQNPVLPKQSPMQHPQPQKNPIYKLLDKKAQVQKFENSRTPPPKSSQLSYLENIKAILIYIQTELCERTLEKYITERNQKLALVPPHLHAYRDLKAKYLHEAKIILEQVISALAYIHKDWQLVHRDLKPSNIFLNKGLNVKIGDFGLVKKLENLTPLEPPPFFVTPAISQESSPLMKKPEKEEKARGNCKETERNCKGNCNKNYDHDNCKENCHNINQKTTNLCNKALRQAAEDIFFVRAKAQTPDFEQKPSDKERKSSFKTRTCGTKVYASPEQMAKDCIFDFRADIYSLGIITIQLFYPMKTEMELIQTLNNAKKHKLPKEFLNDLPQIALLVEKMLDENPDGRPSLKVIAEEIKTIFMGNLKKFFFKIENSDTWLIKWLKIIKKQLYIFASESDPKAEIVYNLADCNISLKNELTDETKEQKNLNREKNCRNFIFVDHSIQISCFLQGVSEEDTSLLHEEIRKCLNLSNNEHF